MDYSLPGSSAHGDSPGKNIGVSSHSPLQGIFMTQRLNPALWADSLPSKPPGKPKNTGVGSLSLLQGIVPTWESNWVLLHCRRILHQLSYQESPSGKEPACQCRKYKRSRFNPWVGKIPWRRAWQPTPVFLPGKSL
ncbi:unnamed protein product [Rangifer tarandus platyrhynchus]|uniref:Uncharacterized protein n=1 Tax=Rangifer tarandus platyrhynchus TaxID=3082113 RepID=A0AC59ZTS8_RANTA